MLHATIEHNTTRTHWRLRLGNETSKWTSWRKGVLTHKFSNGELWCYLSSYWVGYVDLPTEKPFKVTYEL